MTPAQIDPRLYDRREHPGFGRMGASHSDCDECLGRGYSVGRGGTEVPCGCHGATVSYACGGGRRRYIRA